MFETEADYRARVSKLIDLVRSLQAELKAKEQKIRDQLMAELAAQKTPLWNKYVKFARWSLRSGQRK